MNAYSAVNGAENSAGRSKSPVGVAGNFVLDGLVQPDGGVASVRSTTFAIS